MDVPAVPPHVVILPFPSQGHIKPMLTLAELLSQAGFIITFVTTEHSHRRLISSNGSVNINIDQTSHIHFASIPDGLPTDHPRSGPSRSDLYFSISNVCKPIFKDFIMTSDCFKEPPACIISDGTMSFAIEVAEELGIPAFTFRTYNATNTWTCFHLQKLIQDGEIPVSEGNEEMDGLISSIPGLESIMRRRDLPHICRLEPENPLLQFYITQASKMVKASALILNTFEELESPIISHLHSIFPTVYAIGPLHAALKSSMDDLKPHSLYNSTSLMPIDESCLEWLDSQDSKSVLYVSFGSIVGLSGVELMEFWHGLVNSKKPFLWAMRPDLVWDDNGPNKVLEDLKKRPQGMGRIVGWAPQEKVLAHPAVGGFLTHSGWNSTLESIYSGVPMICWPKITDQQGNSRCVSEIWKIGLDMKDSCDRSTVEKMVRDLMVDRRDEIMKSTDAIARLARDSIRDGGSSNRNIKKLIEDIKLLHLTNTTRVVIK